MKTYEEMIQFAADERDNRLRYHVWVGYILLAEMYGKTQDEVGFDIGVELAKREQLRKEQRKAEQRASNEARRLANLAKKEQCLPKVAKEYTMGDWNRDLEDIHGNR